MIRSLVVTVCVAGCPIVASGQTSLPVVTDPAHAAGRAADVPDHDSQRLEPYPLPPIVARSLAEVAARSDVLVMGEVHGSREVPTVGVALLEPLTKVGYGVLAVEVPADQRDDLVSWATGRSPTVPPFFAQPGTDGRRNIQALTLIRTALSAPFRWDLICFDQSNDEASRTTRELLQKMGFAEKLPLALRPDAGMPEAFIAFSKQADAGMATQLARQHEALPNRRKVLALCGNVHARTANRPRPDNPVAPLWPSFTAAFQQAHPDRTVHSLNVEFHGGASFINGATHPLGGAALDAPEVRPTPEGDWTIELHLPRATPATFLAPPTDPPLP